MKKFSHLTGEELRKMFRKPLSKEAAKQLREVRQKAQWLLALNLLEMECEETETDDEKED